MTNIDKSKSIRPTRVLVIEDEALIAMHAEQLLETAGFAVVGPCQTVAQALAHLKTPGCCNVAVVDAQLRRTSALPIAKVLVNQGTPFIVITGSNDAQLIDELAAAPRLTKPFNERSLLNWLNAMVTESQCAVSCDQHDI